MNKNNNGLQKNKNKNDITSVITDLNTKYISYNKIYIKNLINLSSFFENISLVLESIPSKIIFPKLEDDISLKNNPSLNIINKFFNCNKNLINNLKKVSTNIKENIIPKLNNYKNNLETENNDISIFIEDTINKISTHQKKIEETNKNYTIESEKLTKLELDSVKKLNNSSMLGVIHKTLDDQRKKVTNYSLMQQQEIQAMNKLLSESQDEMGKKIFQIKSHYKNNNFIVFESIKEYINGWKDNVSNYNRNEFKKIVEKIDFDEENQNPNTFIDLYLLGINNKNTFYNKWKYNQYKDNNQINIFQNINNETENVVNPLHLLKTPKLPFTEIKYDPEYMLIIKDSDLNEKDESKDINQQKEKKDFLNFFISLRKNKEILNIQLSKIVNLLEQKSGNLDFYNDFCDKYLASINNQIYSLLEFINFTNLAHLKTFMNNILENISLNLKNKSKECFTLLDKIIIIGEKTLVDDIYLCTFLNKNKIFNNKNIWEDCIKFKVIDLLNEICNHNLIDYGAINEGINKLYNKGTKLIGDIFGLELKKITKKENIIEYLGLVKDLPKYNSLSEEKKIILNKNQAPYIIHEVFKIYIRHMSNYNYSLENSINVIYDIYNYFQFNNNDFINYYLIYNNISYYSCKNKKQQNNKKEKTKEKIKEIKSRQKYSIKYSNKLNNERNTIIILKNIFIFLSNKEKIKIITLSKKLKNIISTKIYKNILKQKNSTSSAHLQIWKIIFNYNKSKQNIKTSYGKFKKEIEKPEIKEKYQKIFKIIEVDVTRTEFLKNKEKGKLAINNVLKCLQLFSTENNYCQGLNYLAAFLYEITLNEEDTYFIIISLFSIKKYSEIFKNEMEKLKNFFIITERLIHLFLPKIYSHFKNNQIIPDFFLSPYFITLFTHIYPGIKEKNNILILRVLDEFIINGWKSIFESVLALLKFKEKNILIHQGDELVDFLVNKINKDEIFLNKNYKKYEEIKKSFKIPNELMTNLEEEIKLEKKLQK